MDFSIFLYYVGGVVLNFTICFGMYLFLFTLEIAWFGNSVSGVDGVQFCSAVALAVLWSWERFILLVDG